MKKAVIPLILLVLIGSASAVKLEFSDDFVVDGTQVYLKDSPEVTFEMPEDLDAAFLELPENIEINSIYIYLINETPMIRLNFTIHLNMLLFTYSPDVSVTINSKTQEIINIELPWFARIFEKRILELIQENTKSTSEFVFSTDSLKN